MNEHWTEMARRALDEGIATMKFRDEYVLKQLMLSQGMPHYEAALELHEAAVEIANEVIRNMEEELQSFSNLEDVRSFFSKISYRQILPSDMKSLHRHIDMGTLEYFDERLVGEFSVMLPAGEYWIGDLCYVMEEDEANTLAGLYDESVGADRFILHTVNGTPVIAMGTPHGDGTVTVTGYGISRSLYVDSGNIGIMPTSVMDTSLEDSPQKEFLGFKHTFEEPFLINYRRVQYDIDDTVTSPKAGNASACDDFNNEMASIAGFSLEQ